MDYLFMSIMTMVKPTCERVRISTASCFLRRTHLVFPAFSALNCMRHNESCGKPTISRSYERCRVRWTRKQVSPACVRQFWLRRFWTLVFCVFQTMDVRLVWHLFVRIGGDILCTRSCPSSVDIFHENSCFLCTKLASSSHVTPPSKLRRRSGSLHVST